MRGLIGRHVRDALIAACRALMPDVEVSDGYSLLNDDRDTLYVGVADPWSKGPARASSSDLEWATASRPGGRNQDGTITLLAMAIRGDPDIKAARDRAYEIVETVDELARQGWGRRPDDGGLVVILPTAMVPGGEVPAVDAKVDGLLSLAITHEDLDELQPETGVEVGVTFILSYRARI